MAVIDASVAVKWFLSERDSEAALALREQHLAGQVRLAAPDILVYEVSNALMHVPGARAGTIAEEAESLLTIGIGLDPVSAQAIRASVRTALRRGITVYDAAYVALSERLDCELVSADDRQLRAAGHRGRHIRTRPGAA